MNDGVAASSSSGSGDNDNDASENGAVCARANNHSQSDLAALSISLIVRSSLGFLTSTKIPFHLQQQQQDCRQHNVHQQPGLRRRCFPNNKHFPICSHSHSYSFALRAQFYSIYLFINGKSMFKVDCYAGADLMMMPS